MKLIRPLTTIRARPAALRLASSQRASWMCLISDHL